MRCLVFYEDTLSHQASFHDRCLVICLASPSHQLWWQVRCLALCSECFANHSPRRCRCLLFLQGIMRSPRTSARSMPCSLQGLMCSSLITSMVMSSFCKAPFFQPVKHLCVSHVARFRYPVTYTARLQCCSLHQTLLRCHMRRQLGAHTFNVLGPQTTTNKTPGFRPRLLGPPR